MTQRAIPYRMMPLGRKHRLTQFRRFNGHTQVNATDLKQMLYPSRDALMELGDWAMQQEEPTQSLMDARLDTLTG